MKPKLPKVLEQPEPTINYRFFNIGKDMTNTCAWQTRINYLQYKRNPDIYLKNCSVVEVIQMLTMEEILKDFNAQKNINRSMDLAALLIRFNMTEYDLANISGISIDKIQRALAGTDEISEKFYDTLTDRVKELNNLNKITLDIYEMPLVVDFERIIAESNENK